MNKGFLSIALLAIFLFSCQTEPQTDYVELRIPEELKNNKEAVEQLQSDAEQLNKVFNSLEEIAQNFVNIKEDINAFDESSDPREFKRSLEKKMDKVKWSMAKFTFNVIWLAGKDYNNEKGHKEIISKLSKGEQIHYTKCLKHLSLKKDVIDMKITQFTRELDELSEAIRKKEELIDKKFNKTSMTRHNEDNIYKTNHNRFLIIRIVIPFIGYLMSMKTLGFI